MLSDYERYQLEWMIKRGHSLNELMDELTHYQNGPEADCLTMREFFQYWLNDQGDLYVPEMLALYDGTFYDQERGTLMASFMSDPDDPTIEIYKASTADLQKLTYELSEADIKYGQRPNELAHDNCEHVDTFRTLSDLRDAGYLDSELVDFTTTQVMVDGVMCLTSRDYMSAEEQRRHPLYTCPAFPRQLQRRSRRELQRLRPLSARMDDRPRTQPR